MGSQELQDALAGTVKAMVYLMEDIANLKNNFGALIETLKSTAGHEFKQTYFENCLKNYKTQHAPESEYDQVFRKLQQMEQKFLKIEPSAQN
jgi:hypothetical protein